MIWRLCPASGFGSPLISGTVFRIAMPGSEPQSLTIVNESGTWVTVAIALFGLVFAPAAPQV